MTVLAADLVQELAAVVGEPVTFEVLKDKPGRRCTARARGPAGTAIVKAYASDRAPVVAARVAALAAGPPEPQVPRLLRLHRAARLVVLTDVAGYPLTTAVASRDLAVCRRAGAALGRWHTAWWRTAPKALRRHTAERELSVLTARAEEASPALRRAFGRSIAAMSAEWPCPTVVHRDLYEEQVVVGDRIGLIDLDDAAAGPPELDIGNLLAHVTLLGRRLGRSTVLPRNALLAGYRETGPALDTARLVQCERLSRLRLALIHAQAALLPR